MSETCCCLGSDGILDKYPENRDALAAYMDTLPLNDSIENNRGYLIQCLHKAQDLYTFLPVSVQLFVANKLGLHLSKVYGVISFYSYFTDTPVGKFQINVCTGTACFVRGADKLVSEFTRLLGIKEGETTKDERFSLGGLRCVGACSLAPVVMVNEKVYGNVEPKMVQEILNDCE